MPPPKILFGAIFVTAHKVSTCAIPKMILPGSRFTTWPTGGHDTTTEVVGALVNTVGLRVGPVVFVLVGLNVGDTVGANVVLCLNMTSSIKSARVRGKKYPSSKVILSQEAMCRRKGGISCKGNDRK